MSARLSGALALMLLLAPTVRSAEPDTKGVHGLTMGTTWSVVLGEDSVASELNKLQREMQAVVDRVESQFSTYRSDSEISRFNAYSGTNWFPVSEDVARLTAIACAISARTGGAFDITAAPLVEAWGFGTERHSTRPDSATLGRLREFSRVSKIAVRHDPPALRKLDPRVQVTFSAIGKGFAVDQMVVRLRSLDVGNALVQVGGETFALGERAGGGPWRVAVELPGMGTECTEVVELSNRALCTSGIERNRRVVDGKIVPHIVDPRSGTPVGAGVLSASVIAGSAAEADALATASVVLGLERTLALAEESGIPVLMAIRSNGVVKSRASTRWVRATW